MREDSLGVERCVALGWDAEWKQETQLPRTFGSLLGAVIGPPPCAKKEHEYALV